jgi:lipopolysaccharide export system protein LptC
LQFFVFFFLLFSSCSNDPKEVETYVSIEDMPIEVMKEAELIYTEQGKIKVKIMAEKIERFLNQNPSVYFSNGVLVHFYNDSANITSTLTAEQASIDDKNQQMMAKTNVELINQKE